MSARSITVGRDTARRGTGRLDEAVQAFRLVDVLQERADAMEHRPKRARTRAAIIAATAQVMEQSGIDGLTVAKVAGAAGLAHGTFYLYFTNRIAAAMRLVK
jgi:hypothetical protein